MLGSFGSPKSRAQYAHVIAEWEENKRGIVRGAIASDGISINELILAFLESRPIAFASASTTPCESTSPWRPLSYLKEDLRQIWSQPDKATARCVLDDSIRRANASGIRMLQKFATTLATHRAGILAYYDCRISTGPLEGTNS